jgi:hypothetical protein
MSLDPIGVYHIGLQRRSSRKRKTQIDPRSRFMRVQGAHSAERNA